MLSDDEKSNFLRISSLFCICDAPILWDGKNEEEITGETDLSEISINIGDTKEKIIRDIFRECRPDNFSDSLPSFLKNKHGDPEKPAEFREIEREFIDKLKLLPLVKQNDISQRQVIAVPMLQQLARFNEASSVTTNKVMLFELLLLSQSGGSVSEAENALINEFVTASDTDRFIVDDLTERADAINREIVRTLSLILE